MDGVEELKDALSLVRVLARSLADCERRLRCEITRRQTAERMRRHRASRCKGSPRRKAA